jgi:putative ABC transport system permease protein
MTRPPPLARALIDRLVAPHLRDAVAGDLAELHAEEAPHHPRRAAIRYWLRAVAAAWHLGRGGGRPGTPTVQGASVMGTLWTDLTHGLRLFVTQPGYAWAAVVTLALAIGANTLIFSIANVLVIKPLPFERSERLGWILSTGPTALQGRGGVSLSEYVVYRDQVSAFSQLAARRVVPVTLRTADQADRVVAQEVVGDLQGTWGLRAALGRLLRPADEGPGAARVVVLSHRFWTTKFAAAPAVIGQDVVVNGQPHTIVGVVSPDIELGNQSEIDLWLPLAEDPALVSSRERQWRPVGRLADRATVAEAGAQVAAIAQRLSREQPETNRDWTARVGTTRDSMVGVTAWLTLTLLFIVVGLLLVLACANVMNLLIARLIGRRQELAVRTALGATRGRMVGQIVAESLIIGVAGGVLGLAIAEGGLRGVHAVATEPFFRQLALDFRVVAFALGLAFLAPLVFAIVPTLRVLRHDVRSSLTDATARSVGGAVASRGRSALVVLQVSLAVMLLVVAGLIVRSMNAVLRIDLGYDPARLLSAEVEVPAWKEADDLAALRLRQRLLTRARQIPGVDGAALVTELPALRFPQNSPFDIAGRDSTSRDRPAAGVVVTTPDYFAVVGVPLLAGRGFEGADAASSRPVAVVSSEAARRYWGDAATALGAVVRLPAGESNAAVEATVIGVSRDTANPDVDQPPQPVMFLLDEHRPSRRMVILLRADTPAALAPALRAAVRDVDADLPLYQLRTAADGFENENSSNRLLVGMFAAFAIVAVLLATTGLYGVMSYAVSQRTPEIAVRLALGAPVTGIAAAVVGRSVGLAAVGAVLGMAGALALSQAMSAVLFGVTATDPATYAGAAMLAMAASLVAAWIPMRRAVGIDPIQSLRSV